MRGAQPFNRGGAAVAGKMAKLDHLEEVKVVTRFP